MKPEMEMQQSWPLALSRRYGAAGDLVDGRAGVTRAAAAAARAAARAAHAAAEAGAVAARAGQALGGLEQARRAAR